MEKLGAGIALAGLAWTFGKMWIHWNSVTYTRACGKYDTDGSGWFLLILMAFLSMSIVCG